jgi:hypothetical protein
MMNGSKPAQTAAVAIRGLNRETMEWIDPKAFANNKRNAHKRQKEVIASEVTHNAKHRRQCGHEPGETQQSGSPFRSKQRYGGVRGNNQRRHDRNITDSSALEIERPQK